MLDVVERQASRCGFYSPTRAGGARRPVACGWTLSSLRPGTSTRPAASANNLQRRAGSYVQRDTAARPAPLLHKPSSWQLPAGNNRLSSLPPRDPPSPSTSPAHPARPPSIAAAAVSHIPDGEHPPTPPLFAPTAPRRVASGMRLIRSIHSRIDVQE